MQVAQYIFQSPSPSQVQIGKLDTTVKQNDSSNSAPVGVNDVATKAKAFEQTQIKEVTTTVKPNKLDIFV